MLYVQFKQKEKQSIYSRGHLDSSDVKCGRLMCCVVLSHTIQILYYFRIMQKIHDENLTLNSVGQFAKFLQDMKLEYRAD